MKQKKEYIKNIDNFKEKFQKLNFKIENLFNEENNKIFIVYILKNKEKIPSDKKEFKFNTFFVDGSMSKIGNTFPNYYYIFRALSYSPNFEIKVYLYDIFSPLIDEDRILFEEKLKSVVKNKEENIDLNFTNINYVEEYLRYVLMAKLEIEAANESLNYLDEGDIIFMDGSLTHFRGECPQEFNSLLKKGFKKKILLCGIVEDIGSMVISNIFEVNNISKLGDKELLIGNLQEGEMLHIKEPYRKEGFSTTFLRLSKDPTPISFELPNIYSDKYKEIASYLLFITERHGRGIPFFRDMSHEDVKLSDEESFLISKNFIKSEFLEKLFKLKKVVKMKDIYVVGESSQFEIYIASREERFSLRDYFFVIDEKEYLGEVVESYTINKFFPRPDLGRERDEKIIEHIKLLGFDIEKEDINIAKLKLLDEPPYPIRVGSRARRANFSEIKNIFKVEEKGLILGGIKNSERFYDELPSKLKNLYKIIEDGKEREQREIPFVFTIEEMIQYPHIGIFGGSGSGKSFLVRVLIEEIAKFGYPAIIFDPHFEMSFSSLNKEDIGISEIIKNIKVFTVGENTGIDFSEISERELENLFKSIGEVEIPQEDVIYNAYYMMGNEKSLSAFRNNLIELSQKKGEEGDKTIVSRSSARAVLRKLSHLERLNIFGKSDRELLNWIKDEKIAVIQGSLETLKTFASFFLDKVVEKRRDYKDGEKKGERKEYFPPFFVILDEAHNFAPKESIYFIPSKRVLKTISQEGRKYGIFLVLSTQRPSLLDDTILAQLSTKFILRTVRETDLDTIRKETDLSNVDISRLPYLKTGDAFVSSAIFQRSIPIRVRKTFTNPPPSKNPFLELREKKEDKKECILSYLKKEGVIEEIFLERILMDFESEGINFKDLNEIKIILNEIYSEGLIEKEENPITTIWRLKNAH